MTKRSPFRCFRTSSAILRLGVMLDVRFPQSLPNTENLLYEGGVEPSHETVRRWWQRFGPMCAAEARMQRAGE